MQKDLDGGERVGRGLVHLSFPLGGRNEMEEGRKRWNCKVHICVPIPNLYQVCN